MHCPGCTKHYGPSPSCPGCGHEDRIADLERQLAEAQDRTETQVARAVKAEDDTTRMRKLLELVEQGRDALKAALALAQEWAVAYAALSSGEDAAESNRLELAFNAVCERLYEALDVEKGVYLPGGKWPAMEHGKNCPKVMHNPTGGYLHGANDDRPYDVDGVGYCGRCHVALDVGKEAK